MKNREYRDYLDDILNAIKDIDGFVEGMDFYAFLHDKEKTFATIYCLQIIGEAAKKIPDAIKEKRQEIPWRNVAGMRDRLIHGYFTVDFERVWETIKRDLPHLKKDVEMILKGIQDCAN